MSLDFSKFDKKVDLEGLKKDIESAKENTGNGDYAEVPVGDYEVSVDKMELIESSKHDPMVSIWFKILSGPFKNSRLFYNQVITQGFQIHQANELLRSLDSGLDITFETYEQYANLLLDVHEAINGNLEYAVEYGKNNKGYSTYKITEVFEV